MNNEPTLQEQLMYWSFNKARASAQLSNPSLTPQQEWRWAKAYDLAAERCAELEYALQTQAA